MGKTSGKKIFILVLFFLLITTSFLYAANIRLIMNFDNVQKTLIVSTDITYDQLFSRFVLLFEKYKVTPSMIDMYIKGKRIDSTGALAAALYDYRSEDYATVQVDIRYSARGRQMLGESAAGEQNGEQQPGVDPSRVKVMAELEAKKALQEAAGKGGVIKRKLDRILDNLGRDEMQIRLDGDRQKADQDFDTYRGKEIIRLILEKKLTEDSLYWDPQTKEWTTASDSSRFRQMFDALSEISLDDRIKVDYSEANRILKNAGMDPAYGVKYLYPVREWLQ